MFKWLLLCKLLSYRITIFDKVFSYALGKLYLTSGEDLLIQTTSVGHKLNNLVQWFPIVKPSCSQYRAAFIPTVPSKVNLCLTSLVVGTVSISILAVITAAGPTQRRRRPLQLAVFVPVSDFLVCRPAKSRVCVTELQAWWWWRLVCDKVPLQGRYKLINFLTATPTSRCRWDTRSKEGG